jgi:hypothetical protein
MDISFYNKILLGIALGSELGYLIGFYSYPILGFTEFRYPCLTDRILYPIASAYLCINLDYYLSF